MKPRSEHDEANCGAASSLRSLCRMGGIAALILVAYSLGTMVQLVVLGGPPTTAAEAFNLLQNHRVMGLLRLDLPTVAILPLYDLVFLGLFAALGQVNRAIALLSVVLAIVGTTLILATPTALSLLPLSEKYAAASDEATRAQLLAAGEALMANDIWHGTGAIFGGMLLQCGAALICVVMLRGGVFSKATGWLGIVMHGLDLAHIATGPFLPGFGVVLMAVAGPLYPIWFFMVGRRLLQMGARFV